MFLEDLMKQVSAGLLLIFQQSTAEVGERLRADVVAQSLLAESVPDTEVEEIRVFELLVRQAHELFENLQRDQFVDRFVRPTVAVMIEHLKLCLIDLGKDVSVKMRRPMILQFGLWTGREILDGREERFLFVLVILFEHLSHQYDDYSD